MAEAKGSLRHVRWYVNQAPDQLDAAVFTASSSLAAAATQRPEWVSPLAGDDYLECWNERFLERLFELFHAREQSNVARCVRLSQSR